LPFALLGFVDFFVTGRTGAEYRIKLTLE